MVFDFSTTLIFNKFALMGFYLTISFLNKSKFTRTETEVVFDFPEADISWRQSFVLNWKYLISKVILRKEIYKIRQNKRIDYIGLETWIVLPW